MSLKQNDEYLEQMRELEVCPYCRSEITRVGDLDYCGECEVITEGHTERESEEHFETVAKEELWWEQAGWRDVAKHLQDEWEKTFKEIFN